MLRAQRVHQCSAVVPGKAPTHFAEGHWLGSPGPVSVELAMRAPAHSTQDRYEGKDATDRTSLTESLELSVPPVTFCNQRISLCHECSDRLSDTSELGFRLMQLSLYRLQSCFRLLELTVHLLKS